MRGETREIIRITESNIEFRKGGWRVHKKKREELRRGFSIS